MPPAEPPGLTELLAETPWEREGDTLVRELQLADFRAAIALVVQVAFVAEAADHHPDVLVHGWNRVRLAVTTHSAGALTAKDVALARAVEDL